LSLFKRRREKGIGLVLIGVRGFFDL